MKVRHAIPLDSHPREKWVISLIDLYAEKGRIFPGCVITTRQRSRQQRISQIHEQVVAGIE
jgi:hypothetical protein